MNLAAIIWLLIGFGLGAILAGWWVGRRLRRESDEAEIRAIVKVSRLTLQLDQARDREALIAAEAAHWSRCYLAASTPQRVDVFHHLPADPGEEWKNQ